MASWPTAIKREVVGYIAMMLGPTCKEARVSQWHLGRTANACLRTESQVPEYSDDLVNQCSRTDRRANHDVHPLLVVRLYLVVDGEELEASVSL